MPLSIDRSLTKAKTLARRGDVVAAQAVYDEVLAQYPDNKRAREGRASLTDPSLTEERNPAARKMLLTALALQKSGRLEEAEQVAFRLVADHPSAKAYFALGSIHLQRGEFRGAAEAFSQAIKLQPTFAKAYNNLGNALFRLGEHENAALAYHEATNHDDAFANAYSNLGAVFLEMNRLQPALRCLDVALELDPTIVAAHNNRGTVLRELGRTDEALECFDEALRLSPNDPEVLSKLGHLMRATDRRDEAIAYFDKVLSQNADETKNPFHLAAVYNHLGVIYNDLGEFDAARHAYRRSLDVQPDYAHAHYNLSMLKRYTPDDPHVAEMRRLLDEGPSADYRMHLSFALGKAAADCGDVDEAFLRFSEGNDIRRAKSAYKPAAARQTQRTIKERTLGLRPLQIDEEPRHRPIFIVGMPRSGTTLVEQILTSHSTVYGGGEMMHLRQFAVEKLQNTKTLEPDDLLAIRNAYLGKLADLRVDEPIITDKLPANFNWIGIIAAALPEAKIVDLRRDPRATCWSIFRRYFSTRGNDYAYGLVDVADYYGLYLDIMKFWNKNLPGRVYGLNYERLTEDQENQTRQLLDYCGLPFEEACLNFHRNKRAVATASSVQVRKGLYKGSSESWKAYEAHLGPMLEKLAEVGAI